MSRLTLILVLGLPGTGKTTFADSLSKVMGIRHLNSDIVRSSIGQRGQYDPESKAAIYQEMLEQGRDMLESGQSLIVDATFYRSNLRDQFKQLGEQVGAKIKWIEIKASEAVIENRVNKKRAYSEADFEVYQKIKKDFEPLKEPHLILWSDELDVREMVDKAEDYLFMQQS